MKLSENKHLVASLYFGLGGKAKNYRTHHLIVDGLGFG